MLIDCSVCGALPHLTFHQTITVPRLEAGRRGSAEGLQGIYNDIVNWVSTECKCVELLAA